MGTCLAWKHCQRKEGEHGAGQGMKKLESIQVPVPEMPMQRRFAEVQARIQAARRPNTQASDELKTLMPAALEQVFAGVLRPHSIRSMKRGLERLKNGYRTPSGGWSGARILSPNTST